MRRAPRITILLAAGGMLLQVGGCAGLAAESLVRIAATVVFTPINDVVLGLLSGQTI